MMTFITRGGERIEVTKEDRQATRSEGMGLEESANRALMRQCVGGRSGIQVVVCVCCPVCFLVSRSFFFGSSTIGPTKKERSPVCPTSCDCSEERLYECKSVFSTR